MFEISETSKNNPFFATNDNQLYKLNNYQAMRAIYEIIDNRGKLPLTETLREYVQHGFPGNASNAKTLANKLQKFSQCWNASTEQSRQSVIRVISGYFDFWTSEENRSEYPRSMQLYRSEAEHLPTYFDVDLYLDAILGNGTIKQLPDSTNEKYFQLASNWARDVRNFQKVYDEEIS